MSHGVQQPDAPVLAFGSFRLLPVQRVLLEGDQPIRLGSRAFEILFALIERSGDIVGKEELIARVWPNTIVEEATLRVHIAALRKVLGCDNNGRYVENISGRGYRFVAPVTRLGDSKPAPVARIDPTARLSELPAPFSRVIGRADVVKDLTARLPQRRFVTVVGPGGIGKTTVAVATAERLAASYAQGACFVDLATVTDHALVPATLASALGLAVHTDDPMPAILAFLAEKQLMIVLDNCEHVIESAAAVAERLLRAAPKVHILATSREALRAEGEWVHHLGPLSIPPPSASLATAEALEFSAIRLFVERAAASLDSFELDESDVPIVADLCRRLDGVPLAIELAVARIDLFGARGLAARLGDSLQLLNKGRRTAVSRHQTLRATLDWSHGLLSETEQVILRRIAVFPGRFDLESAGAVATSGEIGAGELLDGITSLSAKSLITTDVTGEQVLFRLLETTRLYALEKLEACGEGRTTRQRHAELCCAMCEEARNPSTSTAAWLARFGRMVDDVRVALEWCFSPEGDATMGAKLTVVSAPIWFQLSIVDEYRRDLERAQRALKASNAPDAATDMKLNVMLGYAYMHTTGPLPGMTAAFERALEIADLLGETTAQWRALWGLGMARVAAGHYSSAVELSRRALHAAAPLGDEPVIMSERLLAMSHHFAGNQAIARRHAERVLAHDVATGSWIGNDAYQLNHHVAARGLLAEILWLQGFPDRALHTAQQAVAEGLSADHALSLCFALFCACPAALWAGDLPAASRLVAMLLKHSAQCSLPYWHFWGRCFAAALRLRRHELAGPPGTFLELLRNPFFSAVHLETLTTICEQPFAADAIARAEAGVATWCRPELLRIEAESILKDSGSDSAGAAEALLRRSLDAAREQGALSWELRTATSLARLWRKQDRGLRAHALLASVYGRFTEGFETADLVKARSLLDDLAASL
jgi:predicted ATPase/DNA-binding winged helix-turn-helix (wHTH) protein